LSHDNERVAGARSPLTAGADSTALTRAGRLHPDPVQEGEP
jgi:hypothetical protein